MSHSYGWLVVEETPKSSKIQEYLSIIELGNALSGGVHYF
jgi:hypothetical protein